MTIRNNFEWSEKDYPLLNHPFSNLFVKMLNCPASRRDLFIIPVSAFLSPSPSMTTNFTPTNNFLFYRPLTCKLSFWHISYANLRLGKETLVKTFHFKPLKISTESSLHISSHDSFLGTHGSMRNNLFPESGWRLGYTLFL